MEYEKLGEVSLDDEEENRSLYKSESGKIQAKASEHEVGAAKAFLSVVDQKCGISLYDHIMSMLRVILRSKIENAVEEFEDISLALKRKGTEVESEITEARPPDEKLKKFIEDRKQFLQLEKQDIVEVKSDSEDEDDDDAEEDEKEEQPKLCDILPDLFHTIDRLRLCGIGLSTDETFELCLAMKKLAQNFKLQKVRFWGKIFTLKGCYYIAECPYQADVTLDNFGWNYEDEAEDQLATQSSGSVDGDDSKEKSVEEEEKNNSENLEENEDENVESKEKAPPPIPEPKQKKKKTVPAEEAGTGVNEFGMPWRCLPLLKPFHIVKARQLKRFFSGNLEDEIRGCVIFDGKEAHYLRSQIARISSCTFISPESFYTLHSEADEDEENAKEDDEDATKKNEILKNEKYEAKSVQELFTQGLEGWVHSRLAILEQGRCTPMKSRAEEEKEEEGDADEDENAKDTVENEEGDHEQEKDQDEIDILEAIKETSVPLLRAISEDKAIGRLDPWTISLSSKLLVEKAMIILRSNLWPGAYTFYDGKSFDHIYIGYGQKYSVFHYGPPIYIPWQKEYKVGPEVIEHVDEPPAPQKTETDDEKNSDEEANKENEQEDGEE